MASSAIYSSLSDHATVSCARPVHTFTKKLMVSCLETLQSQVLTEDGGSQCSPVHSCQPSCKLLAIPKTEVHTWSCSEATFVEQPVDDEIATQEIEDTTAIVVFYSVEIGYSNLKLTQSKEVLQVKAAAGGNGVLVTAYQPNSEKDALVKFFPLARVLIGSLGDKEGTRSKFQCMV